jgi:hypothetical protein
MNRDDIEKLIEGGGEGLSLEHRAALGICRALICIEAADPVAFWPSMPLEIRTEALACIDTVVEKLVGLAVAERLGRIVRSHKESKS